MSSERIIFLREDLYSKFDYRRFGIDTLEKRGFTVEFWDCSKILRPQFYEAEQVYNINEFSGVRRLEKKSLLLDKIDGLTSNDTLITFLDLSIITWSVLRHISDTQVIWGTCRQGALPIPSGESSFYSRKELDIDYMISVNNHQIFKKALITAPTKAVLNFHNGPLPKYGGLNACTWAIYNNESMHGVTWHYMSEKIDQGEIIVQSCFDINNSDTAISLIMKSVIEGVKLFRGLLPDICKDSLVSYKQDLSKRTYYPSNQIPNSGYIDFSWGSKEFQRFRKAFSVYPFTNLLPPPRVKIANETYELLEYDYVIENTEKICLGQMYYDKKKMLLLIGMKEGFLEVKKVLDHELDEILLTYSSKEA